MPFSSSRSARNATRTTKVAPCSPWAGPNTAPRNEWAIMIWSETSTAYTGPSLFSSLHPAGGRSSKSIIDHGAEHIGFGRKQPRQLLRQVAEPRSLIEERIERRIGEQLDGCREPAGMGELRAPRRRDLADLAGY